MDVLEARLFCRGALRIAPAAEVDPNKVVLHSELGSCISAFLYRLSQGLVGFLSSSESERRYNKGTHLNFRWVPFFA